MDIEKGYRVFGVFVLGLLLGMVLYAAVTGDVSTPVGGSGSAMTGNASLCTYCISV